MPHYNTLTEHGKPMSAMLSPANLTGLHKAVLTVKHAPGIRFQSKLVTQNALLNAIIAEYLSCPLNTQLRRFKAGASIVTKELETVMEGAGK